MFGQVDATMQGNKFAPTNEDEEPPGARDADAWDYVGFEGADEGANHLQEDLEE